LGTSTPLGSA